MNVLLVEDETHTAALLKEIIEQDVEFKVVKSLKTVVDTVFYLSANQDEIDLCFFDIQLADGPSFEIFKHVDIVVPVIFCTAFDEYAMQAIKNNGIDYVLKPFKEEEILQALEKYGKLVSKFQKNPVPPIHFKDEKSNISQEKFLTNFRGKTTIRNIEEVALFQIRNETLYLVTFDGEKYPLHKNMEYLESITDSRKFFRVNRQMLLCREAIESFEPLPSRKLIVHLSTRIEEEVIVSRLKVANFKRWVKVS